MQGISSKCLILTDLVETCTYIIFLVACVVRQALDMASA
jgi:hypothetical protein